MAICVGGGCAKGQITQFLIVAAKDPMGAYLEERVQVVKGSPNSEGETREKIWDVVLSDQRIPGKTTAPAITSTVDIRAANYTNTVLPQGVPAEQQERAYSSSIWYTP